MSFGCGARTNFSVHHVTCGSVPSSHSLPVVEYGFRVCVESVRRVESGSTRRRHDQLFSDFSGIDAVVVETRPWLRLERVARIACGGRAVPVQSTMGEINVSLLVSYSQGRPIGGVARSRLAKTARVGNTIGVIIL